MKWTYLFKTTFNNLKSNKVRSALTTLGIVIGITSVIMMMSLGQGAQNLIVGQIASTGSNNIYIEPGTWDPKKGPGLQSALEEQTIKTLKIEDAEAVEKDPLIELAAPYVFGVSRVVYKNVDKKVTFYGITPSAHKINEIYPVLGREITNDDVKTMAKVVILGHKIKKDLFGDENFLGEKIRIKNTVFRVIGVMEEKGTQMFINLDEIIYLPITTAQKLLLGIDHVRWIIAKARNENVIDQAVENIRLTLRERHGINNPENDLSKDDFKVMSQVETTEMVGQITGILTVLLSSIAAIALLVGGIGIMNIMLVSVTERTREIGLRKALGATKKNILIQFLLEAIILTIIGGVIGIILGAGLSFLTSIILSKFVAADWPFTFSFSAAFLGLGVAMFVGLIFGLYPARQAAIKNPIEALRYE